MVGLIVRIRLRWRSVLLTGVYKIYESYTLGYANFGNNENFHLLHFAVHQTNDREQISDFIFWI